HEQLERGGLAGAIGSEKTKGSTHSHLEIERLQCRAQLPFPEANRIVFREALSFYGMHRRFNRNVSLFYPGSKRASIRTTVTLVCDCRILRRINAYGVGDRRTQLPGRGYLLPDNAILHRTEVLPARSVPAARCHCECVRRNRNLGARGQIEFVSTLDARLRCA